MNLLIMISLAVGLASVIVIMSVMNALQHDVLTYLRTIETFHIESEDITEEDPSEVIAALSMIKGVTHVYPFAQTRGIIQSEGSGSSSSVIIRGVPDELLEEENPFTEQSQFQVFLDKEIPSVMLGFPLYSQFAFSPGEPVLLTFLGKGKTLSLTVKASRLPFGGIFTTHLSQFNSGTILVPLSFLLEEIGSDKITYGLYVDERTVDRTQNVSEEISRLYPASQNHTWQELHGPFHSALLLEKAVMYLFLFMMFAIIIFHQKNSTLRLYHAKQREIAVLRSLGVTKRNILSILTLGTLTVTLFGILLGSSFGILIAGNLDMIFQSASTLALNMTGTLNPLLSYPIAGRVDPGEIVLTSLSILLLSLVFTSHVVRGELRHEPMEMLNHE